MYFFLQSNFCDPIMHIRKYNKFHYFIKDILEFFTFPQKSSF